MGNKKVFYRYMIGKVQSKETVGLMLNGAGKMVAKDTETPKILNAFFTLVFTCKTGIQDSQASETS